MMALVSARIDEGTFEPREAAAEGERPGRPANSKKKRYPGRGICRRHPHGSV